MKPKMTISAMERFGRNVRTPLLIACLSVLLSQVKAQSNLRLEEVNGVCAIEAEHFISQSLTSNRKWYVTSTGNTPNVTPDPDGNHSTDNNGNASGESYIEILPDTRVTHSDPLGQGVSFTNTPGAIAVIDYHIYINDPGKYFVWVRAFSTGSEDNGCHVGLDGNWPSSGQKLQWCTGKNDWTWESKQRTDANHCGEAQRIFLNIDTPGEHTLSFSMREDGFEIDKIVLSKAYTKPTGAGPDEVVYKEEGDGCTTEYTLDAIDDFTNLNISGFSPAYVDNARDALGINAALYKDEFAAATSTFTGADGTYDITLTTLAELDGESSYRLAVNGNVVGTYQNPTTNVDYTPTTHIFQDVALTSGDELRMEFSSHTNGEIPEGNSTAYSRGRWTQLQLACADGNDNVDTSTAGLTVTGEKKRWHKVTMTFDGPTASEGGNPNPFTDFNLMVTFSHPSGKTYEVPGYFAACGDAGESSCTSGNKWRVHFAPDRPGDWTYQASFTTGSNVAMNGGGSPVASIHGKTGILTIMESDKSGRDFRTADKGRLQYVGEHYLRHSGTDPDNANGVWFVKAGADAPENMLAYDDFDATPNRGDRRKSWAPHQQDYNASDASAYTWKNGKGTEMLGVVNYLAEKGVNAFSFLTLSLHGDDENVFPYLMKVNESTYNGYNDSQQWSNGVHHDRFDVSKLDQWENVFAYGDLKGMFLHFKTLETENDNIMDGNTFGNERKLYYRELIARFGHHLALNWNLTEESTIPDNVVIQTADYIQSLDPYNHHIVLHTYPGEKSKRYTPLLGNKSELTGASLQTSNRTYDELQNHVLEWLGKSVDAGKKWVICVDEPGNATIGIDNDDNGSDDKLVRSKVLWATFLSGGMGVEYYYGYQTGETDLTAQDHRSRDQKYAEAAIALEFMNAYLNPFLPDMANADGVTAASDDYVLAQAGQLYVIYRPNGGSTSISLPAGSWKVQWFNPRSGGNITSPEDLNGNLVAPNTNDWVAVISINGVDEIDLGNSSPVVNIVSPTGNALLFEGDDIDVEATASDSDGEVVSVALYFDGLLVNTKTSAPYTWTSSEFSQLANLDVGDYLVQVTAIDDQGATRSSSVMISVLEKGLVTLSPIHDAYVQGTSGFNNADLRCENGNRITYVMFDLGTLPPGTIESATLELTVGSDAGSGTFRVFEGSHSNWMETSINSVNAPSAGSELDAQSGTFAIGNTRAWDVSGGMPASGNVSFVLIHDAGGNDVSFASKENGSYAAPKLTVKVEETVTFLQENSAEGVSVYPNPVHSGKIRFSGMLGTSSSFELLDALGRVQATGQIQETVQLPTLAKGTYVLKLNNEQGVSTQLLRIE